MRQLPPAMTPAADATRKYDPYTLQIPFRREAGAELFHVAFHAHKVGQAAFAVYDRVNERPV